MTLTYKMQLITQEALSKKQGVTRSCLYQWRKAGCPCIQKGKFIRYNYDDVINWLQTHDNVKS